MSIILVRHGATALNLARVLQPPDTPLNAGGFAQAEAVARELAALRPAALLSSDLPRALQTAKAIAQATGLPIATTELLRERNFGELRGQAYDQLGFDPLTMAQAPVGGESAEAFERRVALAFAQVVQRRSTLAGPLVVVTHGLVIRAMLAGTIGLSADRLAELHIGNTSVTQLAERPPHGVELLNSTRHLEAGIQDDVRGLVGG
jgi:2,3-bisphosphoglycerate-dependent phosphoglycerate mutase